MVFSVYALGAFCYSDGKLVMIMGIHGHVSILLLQPSPCEETSNQWGYIFTDLDHGKEQYPVNYDHAKDDVQIPPL